MKRIFFCVLVALLGLWLVAGCGGGRRLINGEPPSKDSGTIQVLVTREDKPTAGALCQLSDNVGTAIDQGQTAETGTVAFKNVRAGAGYVVKAELGGATAKEEGIRVTGGPDPIMVKLAIKMLVGPTAVITGKVTDALSSLPIERARLVAGSSKVETASDGTYKLEDVTAGAITLRIEASGYYPAIRDLDIKAGSSQTVNITLDPLAKGPRSGHTIITTLTRVLEIDTWHNTTLAIPAQEAWSAVYAPGSGTILIADASRWGGIAVEIGPGGSKIASFDGAKLGVFGHVKAIRGASRTKGDSTIIADTGKQRVIELDQGNDKLWEYKKDLKAPRWAERLENGNTLIVDTGNNRVIEVNPSGAIVFGIGDGSAQVLNHPTHAQFLKATSTYLVTDAGNNRVLEIDRSNQLVWMAGGSRKIEGENNLNNPNSAIRLPGGNTLIADTGNDRVIEVATALNVVWKMPVTAPLFADRI
ncbi:MAG: carboxypeptidase regulatory-like domain-containing protein [Cyanobacteria bacterium NC_groundwater_1444_Ag_S-0.65um_54_12]|nr:carboxypeptidase regulatory-like domain-containing protein [Cyanobacteria bacterium NC_groundwater_1444_Ag_S-0.65um_54_12]